MPPKRDRLFGVDFSGAHTPARSIWITEAYVQSNGIQVIDSQSAKHRFNIQSSTTRSNVYQELKEFIKSNSDSIFGFDFPFGLPEPVIDDVNSWRKHMNKFQSRFANRSADRFRKNCIGRASSKTGKTHLRRETDWRYGGLCPYQHQINYQTFYGQRDLLAPLISNSDSVVLPMQNIDVNLPWIIEVYPAATLGRLGLYRQGIKRHTAATKRRKLNIEGFRSQGIDIPPAIANRCKDSEHAHDSVAATVGTFSALKRDFDRDRGCPVIEGQIFA